MPLGTALGTGANLWGINQAMGASDSANKQNMGMLNPYMGAGKNALLELSDPAKYFQASPGFNFAMTQGTNAINQDKAVNGLLRSGGTAKAVQSFGTGLADQDFNNWWNQQKGLVDTGLSATNTGVSSNQWNANNQGNLDLAEGNTIASGIGQLSSGWQGQLSNMMSQYMNGGGGSSYGQ